MHLYELFCVSKFSERGFMGVWVNSFRLEPSTTSVTHMSTHTQTHKLTHFIRKLISTKTNKQSCQFMAQA